MARNNPHTIYNKYNLDQPNKLEMPGKWKDQKKELTEEEKENVRDVLDLQSINKESQDFMRKILVMNIFHQKEEEKHTEEQKVYDLNQKNNTPFHISVLKRIQNKQDDNDQEYEEEEYEEEEYEESPMYTMKSKMLQDEKNILFPMRPNSRSSLKSILSRGFSDQYLRPTSQEGKRDQKCNEDVIRTYGRDDVGRFKKVTVPTEELMSYHHGNGTNKTNGYDEDSDMYYNENDDRSICTPGTRRPLSSSSFSSFASFQSSSMSSRPFSSGTLGSIKRPNTTSTMNGINGINGKNRRASTASHHMPPRPRTGTTNDFNHTNTFEQDRNVTSSKRPSTTGIGRRRNTNQTKTRSTKSANRNGRKKRNGRNERKVKNRPETGGSMRGSSILRDDDANNEGYDIKITVTNDDDGEEGFWPFEPMSDTFTGGGSTLLEKEQDHIGSFGFERTDTANTASTISSTGSFNSTTDSTNTTMRSFVESEELQHTAPSQEDLRRLYLHQPPSSYSSSDTQLTHAQGIIYLDMLLSLNDASLEITTTTENMIHFIFEAWLWMDAVRVYNLFLDPKLLLTRTNFFFFFFFFFFIIDFINVPF